MKNYNRNKHQSKPFYGNKSNKTHQPQPKGLKVEVRDNDVNKALRLFKKKVQEDGLLQELRAREFYEKPTAKRKRKKAAGIARQKKKLRDQQLLPPRKF